MSRYPCIQPIQLLQASDVVSLGAGWVTASSLQAVSVRTTQAEKILRVSGWRWLPESGLQGLHSLHCPGPALARLATDSGQQLVNGNDDI